VAALALAPMAVLPEYHRRGVRHFRRLRESSDDCCRAGRRTNGTIILTTRTRRSFNGVRRGPDGERADDLGIRLPQQQLHPIAAPLSLIWHGGCSYIRRRATCEPKEVSPASRLRTTGGTPRHPLPCCTSNWHSSRPPAPPAGGPLLLQPAALIRRTEAFTNTRLRLGRILAAVSGRLVNPRPKTCPASARTDGNSPSST
jgi:hypothetical protein